MGARQSPDSLVRLAPFVLNTATPFAASPRISESTVSLERLKVIATDGEPQIAPLCSRPASRRSRRADAVTCAVPRPPRRHRLEDVLFIQHRGRVPIAALLNNLSMAPISTHTGLELTWNTRLARRFVCESAAHVLPFFEAAAAHDARPRDCLLAAQRFADGELDEAALLVARQGALEASRVFGLAASSAALAAAECALPADWESWPARVLWTCRRAAGEAAYETTFEQAAPELERRRTQHEDRRLAEHARIELLAEQTRLEAQHREQSWQSQRLLEILDEALG